MNEPIRITLPYQFKTAVGLIKRNAEQIDDMLDDVETQAKGIDSVALLQMVDTIEVATRLARTEIHRALKTHNYNARR